MSVFSPTREMIVFYTGVGAKANGRHTALQFLRIMRRTFLTTNLYYCLHGESHNPMRLRNFTLRQWIRWAGATIDSDNQV